MVDTKYQQITRASFEKPIPVLGLHQQHLGVVRRFYLHLEKQTVTALELQTQWQTISLDRSAVRFDSGSEVFMLLRSAADPGG